MTDTTKQPRVAMQAIVTLLASTLQAPSWQWARALIKTAHDTVGAACAQQPLIGDVDRRIETLLKHELVRCSQTGMDAK